MKKFAQLCIVMSSAILMVIFMFLVVSAQSSAQSTSTTIKVPDDYPTIQAAIDAADTGDTILVAAGTYTENLSITEGINLSGGWVDDFTEQDFGTSIIDGNSAGRVISITCALSDTRVIIEGFTIKNGDASGLGGPDINAPTTSIDLPLFSETPPVEGDSDLLSPVERAERLRAELSDLAATDTYPGGMQAYEAMLEQLEWRTTQAEHAWTQAASIPDLPLEQPGGSVGVGGGIYSYNASPHLLDNTILNNVANQNGTGAGGGVYIGGAAPGRVHIFRNWFESNTASNVGDGMGGGMYLFDAPDTVFINNVFTLNAASNRGQGHGGGLFVYESANVRVLGGEFLGNAASKYGDGYGGGLYVTGAPGMIIEDGVFFENIASDAGDEIQGFGGGLMVANSSDVYLRDNEIERNTANGAWSSGTGAGGGIFLTAVDGADVVDNLFKGNLAALRGMGEGGGLTLFETDDIQITENVFKGNWATMYQAALFGVGGGIALDTVYSTTLSANIIQENTAVVYEEGFASGGGIAGSGLSGQTRMTGNTIRGNVACHSGFGEGGGIAIDGAQDVLVADNIMTENVASLEMGWDGTGGGLYLAETVNGQVLRNQFLGNRSGDTFNSDGGGLMVTNFEGVSGSAVVDANLFLDNQPGACDVFMIDNFSFTNNVVANNKTSLSGGLGISRVQEGAVTNNTIVDNGLYGITSSDSGALALINNIVVSHTVGLLVSDGVTVTASYTLWDGNDTDITGTGTIDHTHPVYGDPAFVDPGSHDYHTMLGSAAIAAGDPDGVPPAPDHDADDVDRPQGPRVDIGAYEWLGNWNYLPNVMARFKPTTGWAVGDKKDGYGTILHTTDGGNTWTRQGSTADVPNTDLQEVSAVDAENAWVVGTDAILRTRDGGLTWETQNLPPDLPAGFGFLGIKALDANTVYVVGTPSVLLQTTDGATWSQMPVGADVPDNIGFQVVDAVDTQHVWAVGSIGARTKPVIAFYNGVEWRLQPTPVFTNPHTNSVIGVSAIDQQHAWAVGGWSMPLVTTTDGGATWQVSEHPLSGGDMNRVVAVSTTTGWTSGDYGNVKYTTDAGATWYDVSLPSAFLFGVTAMDDKTAWVVGPGVHGTAPGIIARTRDAQHWDVQSDPSWPNMSGISFVGARR